MKKKRIFSVALAGAMLLPTLAMLSGCGGEEVITLRVYNWEEYIDEGGEGTFIFDELHELDEDGKPVKDAKGNHIHIESDIVNNDYKAWYEEAMGHPLSEEGPRVLDDFCEWYERSHHQKIRVEYSTFGTNEDMYNEIVLGNEYDLLCPSDYMIMKLAAEGRLEKYDESFFDETDPENYYVRNVSPFIAEKFETNAGLEVRKDPDGNEIYWKDYAAGYMWGTTGFVYNPSTLAEAGISEDDLQTLGWNVFTDSRFKGKITAKDNVRDTYFAALGVTYQDKLMALDRTSEDYIPQLTAIFNATDEATIAEVEPTLMDIKENIYSFETDTGKSDMVNGKIWLNYAWSGDAVYALDLAESGKSEDGEDEATAYLNYFVPEAGSNLFFDGWVMPKGANKEAAQAFVNFMSMPQNAMRNSYYIGYTSVIAGESSEDEDPAMLTYADYLYGYYPEDEFEEGEEYDEPVEYDLSYFFYGENHDEDERAWIPADPEQAERRQLFAQFPSEDVIARSAVMDYYDEAASTRINELWSRVKAETLEPWTIVVIVVAVVAIVGGVLLLKFGSRIDFFRKKPKNGYEKVKEERA